MLMDEPEQTKVSIFSALKVVIPTVQPTDIEYKQFTPTPNSKRTRASLGGQRLAGLQSSETEGIHIKVKENSNMGIDNALVVVHAISDFTGYVASTDGQNISFFSGYDDLAAINTPGFLRRVRQDSSLML